jgi:hypothetical protein
MSRAPRKSSIAAAAASSSRSKTRPRTTLIRRTWLDAVLTIVDEDSYETILPPQSLIRSSLLFIHGVVAGHQQELSQGLERPRGVHGKRTRGLLVSGRSLRRWNWRPAATTRRHGQRACQRSVRPAWVASLGPKLACARPRDDDNTKRITPPPASSHFAGHEADKAKQQVAQRVNGPGNGGGDAPALCVLTCERTTREAHGIVGRSDGFRQSPSFREAHDPFLVSRRSWYSIESATRVSLPFGPSVLLDALFRRFPLPSRVRTGPTPCASEPKERALMLTQGRRYLTGAFNDTLLISRWP